MDRVRDYISFAVWFVGISYGAMWAVAAVVAAWLGRAPEGLALSRGLHAIGLLAAFCVTLRLVLIFVPRLARWLTAPRLPSLRLIRRPAERLPPPRYVPPRRQFGLRGEPR